MSKPRQRQSIRAKADQVTECVFLPAHTTQKRRGWLCFSPLQYIRPIITLRHTDVMLFQLRMSVAKDDRKNVVLCSGMPESEICKQ